MANLETAYAIKDSANWMIASEEVVAGKGTAMNYWLQQLIYVPEWDGLRLGRWICEMNMYKYSEQESEHEQNVITWSVIDLSKIERVASAFDGFFAACDQICRRNSESEIITINQAARSERSLILYCSILKPIIIMGI